MKAAKMAVTIETGFTENKLRLKPLWEEEKNAGDDVGEDDHNGGKGDHDGGYDDHDYFPGESFSTRE